MARNKRAKGKQAASSSRSQTPRKGGQAVSYAKVTRTSKPRVKSSGSGVRITHREMLQPVTTGSVPDAYHVQRYAVNPGLPATFPWLSRIASRYEKYKFHRLCLKYVTRAATSDRGTIIIAPDFDASDAYPGSEIEAASYKDAAEGPLWQSFDVPISCASAIWRYIRESANPAGTDIKMYDLANLFVGDVAASGFTSLSCGRLWVEYDVELSIPQMVATGTPIAAAGHFMVVANKTTHPFDGLWHEGAYAAAAGAPINTAGVTDESSGGDGVNVFKVPAGTYNVRAVARFNTTAGYGSTAWNCASQIVVGINPAVLSSPAGSNTVSSFGHQASVTTYNEYSLYSEIVVTFAEVWYVAVEGLYTGVGISGPDSFYMDAGGSLFIESI